MHALALADLLKAWLSQGSLTRLINYWAMIALLSNTPNTLSKTLTRSHMIHMLITPLLFIDHIVDEQK